jgi:hypothetical protein
MAPSGFRRERKKGRRKTERIVREAEVCRRYVDNLVKVRSKEGIQCWVLIHVEVQTTRDAELKFVVPVRLQLPQLRPVQ